MKKEFTESGHRRLYGFIDEIWPESSDKYDINWMYLGALIIEERFFEEVTDTILNKRYKCTQKNWRKVDKDSEFFPKNNKKVKFNSCSSKNEYFISKRWLDFFTGKNEISNKVYFKIIGVDMDKIRHENFGKHGEDRNTRIYSRLLRSLLIGSGKLFFGEDLTKIYNTLYHHRGNQQNSKEFEKILRNIGDKNTVIKDIKFYTDDHKEFDFGSEGFKIANMLQFVDIVLGSTSKLFDVRDLHSDKAKLSWKMKNLVEKSMYNYNTDHFNISFFPQNTYKENKKAEFYNKRKIKRHDPKNKSLKDFV